MSRSVLTYLQGYWWTHTTTVAPLLNGTPFANQISAREMWQKMPMLLVEPHGRLPLTATNQSPGKRVTARRSRASIVKGLCVCFEGWALDIPQQSSHLKSALQHRTASSSRMPGGIPAVLGYNGCPLHLQ